MSYMFSHCESIDNLDVLKFNTNKVINMSKMFSHCYSLKFLDISNFKINNNTNIFGMFSGCSENLKEIIKKQNKNIIKVENCEDYNCN